MMMNKVAFAVEQTNGLCEMLCGKYKWMRNLDCRKYYQKWVADRFYIHIAKMEKGMQY